mgnify:CR=1 FL=1
MLSLFISYSIDLSTNSFKYLEFEDEMKDRVRTALNTKYQSMTASAEDAETVTDEVEEIDVHSGQAVEETTETPAETDEV